MNIFYSKTRLIISSCIYILFFLGYILVAKFFVKTLPPVNVDDNKFAVSILSKATLSPPSPPVLIKEPQEPSPTLPPPPPLPALEKKEEEKLATQKIEEEKKAALKLKKKEEKLKEEKRIALEAQKKLLLKKREEDKALAEKKRLEEIKQREIDMQTIISPISYKDDSLHNIPPKYPVLSRKEEEEGEVILLVKVNAEGKSINIQVLKSSGYLRLDNASVYSVNSWNFIPAKNKLGMPVESVIKIPFRFELKNSKPQY